MSVLVGVAGVREHGGRPSRQFVAELRVSVCCWRPLIQQPGVPEPGGSPFASVEDLHGSAGERVGFGGAAGGSGRNHPVEISDQVVDGQGADDERDGDG